MDGSDSDSEADRQNMGVAGSAINSADKRVVARYIASFGREWGAMRNKDRWDPFAAMVTPFFNRLWTSNQCCCSTLRGQRNHGQKFIVDMREVRSQQNSFCDPTAECLPPWYSHRCKGEEGQKDQTETAVGGEVADGATHMGWTELALSFNEARSR